MTPKSHRDTSNERDISSYQQPKYPINPEPMAEEKLRVSISILEERLKLAESISDKAEVTANKLSACQQQLEKAQEANKILVKALVKIEGYEINVQTIAHDALEKTFNEKL